MQQREERDQFFNALMYKSTRVQNRRGQSVCRRPQSSLAGSESEIRRLELTAAPGYNLNLTEEQRSERIFVSLGKMACSNAYAQDGAMERMQTRGPAQPAGCVRSDKQQIGAEWREIEKTFTWCRGHTCIETTSPKWCRVISQRHKPNACCKTLAHDSASRMSSHRHHGPVPAFISTPTLAEAAVVLA